MIIIGYIALYRKYRPQVFSEVVGQEHITKTLKNQVKTKRTAHAYLFNGPRGTGKTSIAKILARAVNCINNIEGDPCNECEICRGILDGSIMDVIEIDAASNNSVDNVRDIRDEIVYTPSKAKLKVYIIDEVHMLSTGAFNALLKTLEEPPEHVLFILATTEPHKLPATIISRCQRFDFKKISVQSILERLKIILKDIEINVDDKALQLVAHLCDGGMRDALSILDQSLSLGKDTITHEDILSMVGIVDNDILFDLSDAIKDKDISKCISIIDNVYTQGKDLNHFLVRILTHYRNLLMAKSITNLNGVIDMSEDNIQRLKESVNKFTSQEIIDIISIFSETLSDAKKSNYTKILLETAIVKLCRQSSSSTDVSSLLERIDKLENAIQNGTVIKKQQSENKVEDKKQENIKAEIKKQDKIQALSDNSDKDVVAKSVSSSWIKILDDMRSKGFAPLKLQYLNNVLINPFTENAVMAHMEFKEDIGAKMVEEKRFVSELKDSIFKVVGKEIDIRFNIKKVIEQASADEFDAFKEMMIQQGAGKLINEM